ncbi:MAG: hypothetical protein OXG51_12890 [Gammaproteobacteria bacterium]|nr:hypothetical protein [Gammaproteobacteria bacterium]
MTSTLLLLLLGCATPYQPSDFWGDGFTETQLAESVYRVRFTGNESTSAEQAGDFALLRAAELCRQAGHSLLVVHDEDASLSTSTYTTPIQTTTSTSDTGMSGPFAQSTTTTTTGGQSYTTSEPSHTLLVACHQTSPDGSDLVFDVRFVEASLRKKYDIPQVAN